MDLRRLLVRAVFALDSTLDGVLYRPGVVRRLGGLRYSWRCQLARAAVALDERWDLGVWNDEGMLPLSECEACLRRAAWLTVGGWALETEEERGFPLDPAVADDFLANRVVCLCGWCQLPDDIEIRNEGDLRVALASAGRASTGR